jgi:hemolysin III
VKPAHPAAVIPPPAEELANWATHALGLVLSIVGAVALLLVVQTQPDRWKALGCQAYAMTLVALYAASTLSHSFRRPGLRSFFRMLDQAAIFLLIAGTQTPFLMAFFRDTRGAVLLAAVWTLCALGIAFKLCFRRARNVSTPVYLAMGWLPLVSLDQMIDRVPLGAAAWIVAGGALYTLGTFFLERDERMRFGHAIWHLLVVAASGCHFAGVWLYVATS